jgi:hypothetical protein
VLSQGDSQVAFMQNVRYYLGNEENDDEPKIIFLFFLLKAADLRTVYLKTYL